MVVETKVAGTPVVKPEVADGDSVIDNRRTEIEKLVIAENETVPEVPQEESTESKPKDESSEPKPESDEQTDPLERIKKSVQKRIDKVVAQKKSAEEELAEARAEIDRLKSAKVDSTPEVKSDAPPTIEQVEAYIIKMAEEGNKKEEIAATRYLIKLEKESAIKEVEERQNKVKREQEARNAKQLADWVNLSKDYVAYNPDGKVDPKSDLNLSNQAGLLYKTALSLYQDKDLHTDFYNDPDTVQGFRRAVADAYREIHQQGLIKSPRIDSVVRETRIPRVPLADPDADSSEESTPNTNILSDADKVREEIKNRNKNRFGRKVS